ncbi:MAG: H-NS histone family protein [bacterium]|nr:H-NS histone family protein [bacterium]
MKPGRAEIGGRRVVAPKYRDPERPDLTWSGRGKMVRWLREKLEAGGKLEDFLVMKRDVD